MAGVFEADDETSYFYLYKFGNEPNKRIVSAIRIFSGNPDFTEADVDIRWFDDENKVGLLIRQELWAYFDIVSGGQQVGLYPSKPLLWPAQ